MSVKTATKRQACVDLAIAENAKSIVEIGVYSGRLSRMLLTVPSLEMLYLVDSWEGATEDRQPPHFLRLNQKEMDICAKKVKKWAADKHKVRVFHMRSVEASYSFDEGSIDFIYIDGDHTYEGVCLDIERWFPKVRAGGVLSGDDYNMPSVGAAVNSLLPYREILLDNRMWWVRKPNAA